MCELPEAYGCETPTARKNHTCCECRGLIHSGEQYHRHHGIWDGEAETFKVCLECDALRDECDKNIDFPDEKTAFGCLWESVMEIDDPVLICKFLETKLKRGANDFEQAKKSLIH